MAESKESLIVKIGADFGDLRKAVDKSMKSVADLGKRAAKVSAVVGAAVAAGAGAALVAAEKQEKAERGLAQALAATGKLTEQNMTRLLGSASALQAVTTQGDEATIALQALAINMGAGVDQAEKMARAAADMEAAGLMPAESAIRNMSKSMSGLLGELGEAIPSLRVLTKEELQNGAAIDMLATRYAGFAEAQARTLGGMAAQVKNVFGDMLEDVGFAIQESGPMKLLMENQPLVIDGIKSIGAFWVDVVGEMLDWGGQFAAFLAELAAKGFGAISKGIELVDWALSGFEGGFGAVEQAWARIDVQVAKSEKSARAAALRMDDLAESSKVTATQTGRVAGYVADLRSEAPPVVKAFDDVAESSTKAADEAERHLDAVRAMAEARGASFAEDGLQSVDVNAALSAGGDSLFGDSLAPAFAQGLEMAMPGIGGAIGGALGPVIDQLMVSGESAADMVADAIDGLADKVLALFENMPAFFERIIERLPDMLVSAMRLGMTNLPVMLMNPQSIANIVLAAMESVGKMILIPFFLIADIIAGIFGGDLEDTDFGRWILGKDQPGAASGETGAIGRTLRGAGDTLQGGLGTGLADRVRGMGNGVESTPGSAAMGAQSAPAVRMSGGGGGGPQITVVINERENRAGFRADVVRSLRDAFRLGEVSLDVVAGARA